MSRSGRDRIVGRYVPAMLFEEELYKAAGRGVVTGARREEDYYWLFWLLIDQVNPLPGQKQHGLATLACDQGNP